VKTVSDKTDRLSTDNAALTRKVDALAGLVTAMASKRSEPETIKDDVLNAIENATRKLGGIGTAAEHAVENALGHKG
jgi:hypothetical protein